MATKKAVKDPKATKKAVKDPKAETVAAGQTPDEIKWIKRYIHFSALQKRWGIS